MNNHTTCKLPYFHFYKLLFVKNRDKVVSDVLILFNVILAIINGTLCIFNLLETKFKK